MVDIKYEVKMLAKCINRELEEAWLYSEGEPYKVDNEEIIRDCITSWVQDVLVDALEELRNE